MKFSVGKGATLGFAFIIVVLFASGWLSSRNVLRISHNDAMVVHTHEVLDAIRDIFGALRDAEGAQRNYVVTGDQTYLDPYHATVAGVNANLDRLQALTVDNRVQQDRIVVLRPIVAARLDSLQTGVTLFGEEGIDGVRKYIAVGKGRQEMSSVSELLEQMEKTELDLLAIRRSESSLSFQTAMATQVITTALGLCLVLAAYWLTGREVETKRRGVEALARANDQLEDKVQERTAELSLANESLGRSNRELEQFASVASHDLQEPLRKIQAFGDRLLTKSGDSLGEQGRDYLSRMLASATRMRGLIDALLTFSRVTTKAQPFVAVDLRTTADEVVSDLEAQIQRVDGRVEIGSLATLEADPLQMRQLFQNLIGNALKFSRPNQSPVVQVEGRPVPGADSNGEIPSYEITVRDNGIGFEEIYLDRIFELFQRLHGRQEYEGTGMGLAICRKIVERHRGSITAKSTPDHGATFLVTLPIRQE